MKDENYVFSDEEYGKVLDNFAIACVDVAVFYKDKILLERRKYNPIKNEWWIFGGRVMKGESLHDTAKRSLIRELNLEIKDTKRIKEIGTFNLIWPTRREPVASNGCHHLLIAHKIELKDSEFRKIENATSQNRRWFDIYSINESILTELRLIIDRAIES